MDQIVQQLKDREELIESYWNQLELMPTDEDGIIFEKIEGLEKECAALRRSLEIV